MERRRRYYGFTMVELMVTVIIIAIVSVIGTNTLLTRYTQANLESAAQQLASDLATARQTANLKGCPTRFIMCSNKNCTNAASTSLGSYGTPAYIGSAVNAPAQFYAILRETTCCAAPCSDSSQDNAADGYANWDFDVRPRQIPNGIVFSPIYDLGSGALSSSNGAVVSNSVVFGNWLWFSPRLNPSYGTIPITAGHNLTASGNYIAFQLRMANCDPSTSNDCMGYFVTISPGGQTTAKQCFSGGSGRPSSGQSDVCF